jgi:hypothetical protein
MIDIPPAPRKCSLNQQTGANREAGALRVDLALAGRPVLCTGICNTRPRTTRGAWSYDTAPHAANLERVFAPEY